MNRKGLLTLALGALVATAAGGAAYATISDANKVYTACVLNGVGQMRLIDESVPSTTTGRSRRFAFRPPQRGHVDRGDRYFDESIRRARAISRPTFRVNNPV